MAKRQYLPVEEKLIDMKQEKLAEQILDGSKKDNRPAPRVSAGSVQRGFIQGD